eukprot:5632571-Amphidinium_carterae.4
MRVTGRRPVPAGWEDVNKVDSTSPHVRCRLVVKETRHHSTISDPSQTWSATPPYEALRMMISMCMSPKEGEEGFVLQFIDITRAHPHCTMKRDLWIELSQEDPSAGQPGVCGKLERSLYGTRDAGHNFEFLTNDVTCSRLGFKHGLWSPCIFRHGLACREGLQTFVYGDNFVTRGSRSELAWQCNLENAKCVSTPGVKSTATDGGQHLRQRAVLFRSLCMRANYLSVDRPDLSFPAKEIARFMSCPCEAGEQAIKRLSRYVKGVPRLVQHMERQSAQSCLRAYSDSDHAGCARTRKSTSCGVVMYGDHTIKFHCSTQQPIALSSAESEWYALVRTAALCIGLCNMAANFGLELQPHFYWDAMAASGIGHRRGAGKVRHIETSTLWLQHHVSSGRVVLMRQPGDQNPADIGTKHVPAAVLWRHLEFMGFHAMEGKSRIALKAAL